MAHAFVRVSLAFVCLAAGAVACSGDITVGSGPPPFVPARVYVLQSLAGAPLPYDVYANGGDTTQLLNETFTLRGDGTAKRTTTMRTVASRATETITSSTGSYTYTIAGTHIALQVVCPPGALCIAPPSGSVTEAELTLSVGGTTDAPVWRYTRQWPPD